MYVGWTVLYVGIALVLNTAWPLVLLPVVIMLTHRSVLREERRLSRVHAAVVRHGLGGGGPRKSDDADTA